MVTGEETDGGDADRCCSKQKHVMSDECCGAPGEDTGDDREKCCSKTINVETKKCCVLAGEDAKGSEDNCCFPESTINSAGECEDPCPNENVNYNVEDGYKSGGKVDSWEECSAKCMEETADNCKYWSWRRDTHPNENMQKTCVLMTEYTATSDLRIVSGARDCPSASSTAAPEPCVATGEETDGDADRCCSKKKHENSEECCGAPGEDTGDDREKCCSKKVHSATKKCCAVAGEDAEGSEDNCCFPESTINSDGKCVDPCPNENVNFKGPYGVNWKSGGTVDSWEECSAKCKERPEDECKFWSWRRDTHKDPGFQKTCITFSSYSFATTDEDVVSGGRNCPATSTAGPEPPAPTGMCGVKPARLPLLLML